jgi:predicted DNA-binding protein
MPGSRGSITIVSNIPTIIGIMNFRVTTTLIKRLDQLAKERRTATSDQTKWVEECLGAMKDFLSATNELSTQENISRGPARATQVRRLVSKTGVALRSEAYDRLKSVGLPPQSPINHN